MLLRLLTPVLKLFTAKECLAVISEGIECFGAMGYMEDSQIPKIYRDAQVSPIWEGTTNTLSLDFAYALFKDLPNSLKVLNSFFQDFSGGESNILQYYFQRFQTEVKKLR